MIRILGLAFVFFLVACPVRAEEYQLELALFSPLQTIPPDQSVNGDRLTLFYTLNKNVNGFSLALLGVNQTAENVTGAEWGLVNAVGKAMYGWQLGLVNYVEERSVGFQSGVLNITNKKSTGFALGLVNYAGEMHGLQMGVLNMAASLKGGVQIGLVNYNGNKTPHDYMTIVNYSF